MKRFALLVTTYPIPHTYTHIPYPIPPYHKSDKEQSNSPLKPSSTNPHKDKSAAAVPQPYYPKYPFPSPAHPP